MLLQCLSADVTATSESTWQQLNSDNKFEFQLTSTTQQLCGPDRKSLHELGTVPVTLTVNNHSCSQKVYVVRSLQNNLLGLPALHLLQMLPQLNTVQKYSASRANTNGEYGSDLQSRSPNTMVCRHGSSPKTIW